MTHSVVPREDDVLTFVRRGLIALTVVGILATAFELASQRHFSTPLQFVPWAALAVLAVATGLMFLPGGRGTTAVRVLAVIVMLASAFGVLQHTMVNFTMGAFHPSYREVWETLSLLERVGYAFTKTVGTAPALAPGVLAQIALLLALATFCRRRA